MYVGVVTCWTVLLGLHILSCSSQFTFEYSQAICQRKWFERLIWTSQSKALASATDVLKSHILMGKPVKVSITDGSYLESFTVNNLNMNGQIICGELLERMSHPIGPDVEHQPIIVCNDGYVSYLNYSVQGRAKVTEPTVWPVDSITFRTRDYSPEHKPVTSRYIDGSTSSHVTDNFRTMAVKSEMLGVMRDRGYAFTLDNVHIQSDTTHISGQSLGHISQSFTPTGGITFRAASPYHWFSSWETTGRRDSARWTVGDLMPLKHTNDFVALQWFADSCWTIVYVHDSSGGRLDGSLELLKLHVRMGHRVRVHFDGYTLEADSVLVSSDDVIVALTSTEMARRGGNGSDRSFFNTKTRQVYRLIHTTGTVKSYLYFVENGELSAQTTERHNVTWSVDTRPWNPVLSTNPAQNLTTLGSTLELLHALDVASLRVQLVLPESDYRFYGKRSELYLEINNVRTPDQGADTPDVIGQSLRTVPIVREREGREFQLDLYNPVRQFVQISTLTGVTAASFDLSTRDFKENSHWSVDAITWFKDDRIDTEII